MGIKVQSSGLEKHFKTMARKLENGAKSVEIGVTDAAVAPYATYVEYGWVQRVTPKQHKWFIRQGVRNPPKPGSSLVNPPRPFLRGTLTAEGDKWRGIIAAALKKNLNATTALKLAGTQAAQDVRETIRKGGTRTQQFPERSPLTMELINPAKGKTRKGKASKANATTTKPLMLTGRLLNSIHFEVK